MGFGSFFAAAHRFDKRAPVPNSSPDSPASPSVAPIAAIGRFTLSLVGTVGQFFMFTVKGLRCAIFPIIRPRLLVQQLEFVGNLSLGIVLLAGAMIGGIFGLQLGQIFKLFGVESMIGAAAGFALARELAPLVVAFLVTGRAGSAMAAEIASMQVNEQVDAMRVMAVNPYNYLIAPRLIGSIIMMPVLMVFFLVIGVATSFIIGIVVYNVDVADFIARIQWIVSPEDIYMGMQKAALFGLVFSSLGCFQGYFARGGAKGVGAATTRAVVYSYVAILLADYVVTLLQFKFQSG